MLTIVRRAMRGQGWLWFVALLFATSAGPARGQGLDGDAGTVSTLIQQLQTLQDTGALAGFDNPSAGQIVDSSRKGAFAAQRRREDEESRVTEILRDSEVRAARRRVLARSVCDGSSTQEQQRELELFDPLSSIERDYCERTGSFIEQFGYNQFTYPTADVPLAVGAVSDDYVLGVGDELIVTFYGQENRTDQVKIDREGRLSLQKMPPIPAAGRTLGEVRREIQVRTASSFLATEVFVSVGAIRTAAVAVVGAVARPGQHILTGLAQLTDALSRAGGIRRTGSLRRIQLERDGQLMWIDTYELLLGFNTAESLKLRDGDRIVVPSIGATLGVTGAVRQPGVFEFPEGRSEISVGEAIGYAGGAVRPRGIRVLQTTFDRDGQEIVVEHGDLDRAVRDGDIIEVAYAQNIQLGRVELKGHVRREGSRSLASTSTVSALLGGMNALERNPYLLFAALETLDPKTRARRLFPVNLEDILSGAQDYALRDGDSLIVLSGTDIEFLASADVQDIITRRLAEETQRRDLLRDGQDQSKAKEEEQRANQANQNLSSIGGLIRSVAPGTGRGEEKTEDDGALRPTDRLTSLIERITTCKGLQELAEIVASSPANRYAASIRTIGTGNDLRQFAGLDCPRIFNDVPGLLPLALEHVVAVNGEVRRPGAYPVVGTARLSSIIAVSGGMTRSVDLTRVELSRFTPDSVAGAADTSRGTINLAKLGADNAEVSAGDIVRFNAVFTDLDTGPVLLVGEFQRPGLYQIRRGERLSDVIRRAGGITEQAYPLGAIFTREQVKRQQERGFQRATRELNAALAVAAVQQNVNPGSLLALQQLSQQISGIEALGRVVIEADPTVLAVRPELDSVLEPGDRIFMPKRPNFVTVIGDVLNPGALQFISGSGADRYIRQAGGYQRSADQDRVFVVYPNGAAEPLAVSVWNYNPVRIPPGSLIVVPKDPTPFSLFAFVREGSSLISQLAVTAASLAVISRD